MVTSRAVVGSSAISSRGLPDRAMAIIARCRMPPENWWGYWSNRRCGSGIRTLLEHLDGPLAGLARPTCWCRTTASTIWLPMVKTGLSEVIGSWKIMATLPPRIFRMAGSASAVRSTGAAVAAVKPDPSRRRCGPAGRSAA